MSTAAVEEQDETGGRRRGRLRTLVAVSMLALLSVTAVSVALAEPALRHCNTTILGAPGDATSGGVWSAWTYEQLPGSPWPDTTPYTAAPEGEAFWQPQHLTAVALSVPMWALTRVTTPVCAWNLAVFSGYVLSGLAMFALAYWLTRSPWASVFAAFAYTAVPYRQFKAEGHLAYVHGELIPLLLLALLALWQRPTWKRALLVSAALAGMAYTDGYYILLGWTTFVLFTAAALLHRRFARPPSTGSWRMVGLSGLAAAVAILLMAPLALALKSNTETIGASLERPYADLVIFGARPADYALPARSHPVFDSVFGEWQDRRLQGSNYSEKTLYLGWTVLVLAGTYAAMSVRAARRREPDGDGDGAGAGDVGPPSPLPSRFLLVTLGVVALGSLVMSAPPVANVGPVDVPMPSKAIFAVVKFWRVYSRFFGVIHVAVLALAALALVRLLSKRSTGARAAITGALVLVLGFEFLTFPPRGRYSYEVVPGAYTWLRQQAGADIVAEYPLYPTESDPNHRYFTYQPVHGKRLLNSRVAPSPQDDLRRSLFGLGDRDTTAVLRRLGVDLVFLHPELPGAPTGQHPPDLEPVMSFRFESDVRTRADGARLLKYEYLRPFYNVDVYRVGPGPEAELAMSVGDGFYAPETYGWMSYRWMRTQGRLVVRRLAGSQREATVSFSASGAFDVSRDLKVTQDGQTLWAGAVTAATEVRFRAAVERPIDLRLTPGAEPVRKREPTSSDPRSLGIQVWGLTVSPAGP